MVNLMINERMNMNEDDKSINCLESFKNVCINSKIKIFSFRGKLMLPKSNTLKLIFVRGSKLSKREVRMSSYKGHAKKK